MARFALRVRVPGFAERLDDVPLLMRHLARTLLAADPPRRERLCAGDEPRFDAKLVLAAVRRSYTTHARELTELLIRSLAVSDGPLLAAPRDDEEPPAEPEPVEAEPVEPEPPGLTREQLVAALERCGGVRDRAWRELGLSSRYQLRRLLKRHGIE